MNETNRNQMNTKLVVDDTTIYEIDLECFACMSKKKKDEFYDEHSEEEIEQEN